MFSLQRVWLQAAFPLRQLVKSYTLAGNSFYFFDISIVEAKNIINIHIKIYFILVSCWGFYCLT